jgi:hypothetical protein
VRVRVRVRVHVWVNGGAIVHEHVLKATKFVASDKNFDLSCLD